MDTRTWPALGLGTRSSLILFVSRTRNNWGGGADLSKLAASLERDFMSLCMRLSNTSEIPQNLGIRNCLGQYSTINMRAHACPCVRLHKHGVQHGGWWTKFITFPDCV